MPSDRVLWIASGVVLAVQLLFPIATGLPQILKKDEDGKRKPVLKGRHNQWKKRRGAAGEEPRAPGLAPLSCGKCRAPVPLESRSFPCPYCAALVEPPADYVRALDARAVVEKELARAERVWLFSRVTSSRPVTWLAYLLVVCWLAVVVLAWAATSSLEIPGVGFVGFLAFIIACIQTLAGVALVWSFADMRKKLPRVPRRKDLTPLALPADRAPCRGCKAPVSFEAGRLASVCGYCQSDNYRAALAQEARELAGKHARIARSSLLEAVRTHDERREEVLLFFAFMLIAEGFYAVVLTLYEVIDFLGIGDLLDLL